MKSDMTEGYITIKGWIVRDGCNHNYIGSKLFFATEHPDKFEETKEYVNLGPYIPLKKEFYPQVTFESGPIPATMVITLDENR